MATVGLLVHHAHSDAARLADEAAAWLESEGHEVRWLDEAEPEVGKELDLAMSLGGDGTMLRTVDLVSGAEVPIIGVNLGHLGYLAEVEPSNVHDALRRFFAGDYAIDCRMRMSVDVQAAAVHGERAALNEAVLGKTPTGQLARVLVTVDGEPFTTYVADGVIVATPTGSTAYAWSAGGPLVAPTHEALLLTPVAAHMLFDRALVLPPSAHIRL